MKVSSRRVLLIKSAQLTDNIKTKKFCYFAGQLTEHHGGKTFAMTLEKQLLLSLNIRKGYKAFPQPFESVLT